MILDVGSRTVMCFGKINIEERPAGVNANAHAAGCCCMFVCDSIKVYKTSAEMLLMKTN
jgi:hypothetical protein